WAEERLEAVALPAAAPKLPILVSGQNARMTSGNQGGAGDAKKHRMMPVVPPTYEESYKKDYKNVSCNGMMEVAVVLRERIEAECKATFGWLKRNYDDRGGGYSEQVRYQRENSAATAESTPIVEAKEKAKHNTKRHQNGHKKSFLNRLRDANTHASPTRAAAANSPAAAVHRPR
ncbi:hypothetical protein FOZ63_004464, partial [Perkinsus olseni]